MLEQVEGGRLVIRSQGLHHLILGPRRARPRALEARYQHGRPGTLSDDFVSSKSHNEGWLGPCCYLNCFLCDVGATSKANDVDGSKLNRQKNLALFHGLQRGAL